MTTPNFLFALNQLVTVKSGNVYRIYSIWTDASGVVWYSCAQHRDGKDFGPGRKFKETALKAV